MKKAIIEIDINDNMKKALCQFCPLARYIDDFGESFCCEGNIQDDSDCPLQIKEDNQDE